MHVVRTDNGFLLDETFVYKPLKPDEKYINLLPLKGDPMRYQKNATHIIDFPGEYEIRGNKIKVIEVGGLLQYIIHKEDTIVAIISHPDALENNAVSQVKEWLLTNENIRQTLEKLELEGKVQVLE